MRELLRSIGNLVRFHSSHHKRIESRYSTIEQSDTYIYTTLLRGGDGMHIILALQIGRRIAQGWPLGQPLPEYIPVSHTGATLVFGQCHAATTQTSKPVGEETYMLF